MLDADVKKKKARLIMLLIGIVLGLGGWVLLFYLDWRIGIAIFAIVWANNIAGNNK